MWAFSRSHLADLLTAGLTGHACKKALISAVMRVLNAGCEMMEGGMAHTPGPRGGSAAGEIAKVTPYWSAGLVSEMEAALIADSKLSLTSHLSILAEDEPEVAVWVNLLEV